VVDLDLSSVRVGDLMLLCSLERGTGLALFITKAIVEAHNSRINAENNRASGGKRSTFTVSLPLYEQQQQPHQRQGHKRLSLIQSRLKTF
jgi:signal transduction histidine kinase